MAQYKCNHQSPTLARCGCVIVHAHSPHVTGAHEAWSMPEGTLKGSRKTTQIDPCNRSRQGFDTAEPRPTTQVQFFSADPVMCGLSGGPLEGSKSRAEGF